MTIIVMTINDNYCDWNDHNDNHDRLWQITTMLSQAMIMKTMTNDNAADDSQNQQMMKGESLLPWATCQCTWSETHGSMAGRAALGDCQSHTYRQHTESDLCWSVWHWYQSGKMVAGQCRISSYHVAYQGDRLDAEEPEEQHMDQSYKFT